LKIANLSVLREFNNEWMIEKGLTLSIETAVQGGSISLLRGIKELDHWIGLKEVSKSEDVLEEIKNILIRNGLKKDELKRIVVSNGPGSHTGVRIGMAVGIGLRKAIDCELTWVYALEAMLSSDKIQRLDGIDEIISAVPFGRNQVCWQCFKLKNQKNINCEMEPQLSTIENFSDFVRNGKSQNKKKIIMHRKLYSDYRANFENVSAENTIIIDAGENIAVLNAMIETNRDTESEVLAPKYLYT
jgi:tRNA threonylcarbamoyl adenosine modification protein YeaZ